MSSDTLRSYVFVSKYARWLPPHKRRENWDEAVERVVGMHRAKYEGIDIESELSFIQSAMRDGVVLGSQRGLQFGGDPVLRKEARLYNCTASYANRPRFFQEALWLLLCGCGVGFSVQKQHVAKLPPLYPRTKSTKTFVIPDTIEGWADAFGVLCASYGLIDETMDAFSDIVPDMTPDGCFADYCGHPVEFDYSRIRPKGAKLSSNSGKAPGPDPLRASLESIDRHFAAVVKDGHRKMRPIEVYDTLMIASEAVLAGGVRRSASICLFSHDDEEMVRAKTGNWHDTHPHRARSNNSVMLLRETTTFEDFDRIVQSTRQCGEPGFVWTDHLDLVVNPCCEIGLYPQIELNGELEYGFAFCNLCEINAKACHDTKTWERACVAAALLGTLQAGYTDFQYLTPASEAIAKREALLGVSMTGMADNPDMAFDPELQQRMARLIVEVNENFAPKIGVNPTARATCVKPAGSTSCILGTASGIHPHHADRYLRTVQATNDELPMLFYRKHNRKAVRPSPNKEGHMQITFAIEVDDKAETKQEIGALDLLERVKTTQENWVMAGRAAERCVQPWLRHNVSNTINVRDGEWDAVTRFIYDNRSSFTGVSMIAHSGDLDYAGAPMVAVKTLEEIVEAYGPGSALASGLIVDGLHAFGDLWKACSCVIHHGSCPVQPPDDKWPERVREAWIHAENLKQDWIRRADQFAMRYFGFEPGDRARLLKAILPKNEYVESLQEAVEEAATPQIADSYRAQLEIEEAELTKLRKELNTVMEPVRRMTYCLKDVNNFKLWLDLTRDEVVVDYAQMAEVEDTTTMVTVDPACGGGADCNNNI